MNLDMGLATTPKCVSGSLGRELSGCIPGPCTQIQHSACCMGSGLEPHSTTSQGQDGPKTPDGSPHCGSGCSEVAGGAFSQRHLGAADPEVGLPSPPRMLRPAVKGGMADGIFKGRAKDQTVLLSPIPMDSSTGEEYGSALGKGFQPGRQTDRETDKGHMYVHLCKTGSELVRPQKLLAGQTCTVRLHRPEKHPIPLLVELLPKFQSLADLCLCTPPGFNLTLSLSTALTTRS